MDRVFDLGLRFTLVIHRAPQRVKDAAQGHRPHRHTDRRAGVDDRHAAAQAVGGVHRHAAHAITAELLLHFQHQRLLTVTRDFERVVNIGQIVGREQHVDDAPQHLYDFTFLWH